MVGFERQHCKTSLSKTKKASKDQTKTLQGLYQMGVVEKLKWIKENAYVGGLLQSCDHMTLLKRDSAMGIFRGMFRLSLGAAISQNSSERALVRDLYLFTHIRNFPQADLALAMAPCLQPPPALIVSPK